MTEDMIRRCEEIVKEGDRIMHRPPHFETQEHWELLIVAEDLLAECRRLRALVESVKALAYGGHECAGDDTAAIREYLCDLLVSEPDGPIDQRPGAAHAPADRRR